MSFKPFLAYSASAGSGKTFALSARYISLLFMGESPSSILAATFTNKAAAEMRQRVVDSLRELGENEAFLMAVLVETGLSREELFKRQPDVLAQFLSHSSYIVTLDSFFSSILRSASLELGLEPDFVTKEQGTDALEKNFLEEVQAEGLLSNLVKLAINIEDKRFGKIFDLMQNFYKVDPLLPKQKENRDVLLTQEEVCESLRLDMIKALEEEGAVARCMKQFETKSIKELFSKGLFEKSTLGEHSWFKKSSNETTERIYAQLKLELGKWAEIREATVLQSLFKIYDYYRNANISTAKASGVLSFDDLTYFTYRLLHESISKEFLYFKIDSRFKHILLDEFQDTSTLQFLLLKPLIDEIFSGQGQNEFKSFFYVGDTKQSLYRFRGGVEELFDRVAKRYGVTIEQMDTNYRSSKNVVMQVNQWFENTMENYVPQKSRVDANDGYVEVMESETLVDEAVAQVQKLLDLGVSLDSIAFLVHTNKDGQALQEACESKGIDTLLKTSSSLKSVPKIAALVAMISYLFYGEKIDAEALLLRVNRKHEETDFSWFSAFMTPLQAVNRLVKEFGYFENDLNILKLLEFASSFSDMPTFLDEFESSSVSVATNSVHGAQIMTIHGSKGLEFSYVILLDKLTRPNSDKSALLYHYNDELYIDKVIYRMKGRDHFDAFYANILEERKASALKDRKNVLYVALTRAVEALIVIKKPKDSVFDEVNIATVKIGAISTQHPSNIKEDIEVHRESVVITNYGKQEIKTQEDDIEKDYSAILFGTALHYTLEMLENFSIKALEKALMATKNKYGNVLTDEQSKEIQARVERLLGDEHFQTLIHGATIYKEQALSFNGELKQIDLLLKKDNHYIIVDYKSSKKYHLKHEIQVRAYKKAIEKITDTKAKGIILYILNDEIEIVSLN